MNRNSPLSSSYSPATTCSTVSSVSPEQPIIDQKLKINFNDDDYGCEDPLMQFEEPIHNNYPVAEHENLGGESIEELLFWKDYESQLSQFCLSVSCNPLPYQMSDISKSVTTQGNKWDIFNSLAIFQLFFDFSNQRNALRENIHEKENLNLQLEKEKERCRYYQSQVKFYRDKARDLEWKQFDNISPKDTTNRNGTSPRPL